MAESQLAANDLSWWIAVCLLSLQVAHGARTPSDNAIGEPMRLLGVAGALLAAIGLSGQAPPARYVAGQVWEYRTRQQDVGSLLKVQRVEMMGTKKVYHISVVGVHLSTPGISSVLPHIPVSDETLGGSVTKLSATKQDFPTTALDEGIEEWRKAQGGVFTIPVSKIVGIIDDQTAKAKTQNEAPPTGSR